MSDRPLVSVLLPVYNGARFLGEAIESILAQSHENFELLIADDCSGDDSLAIAEKYAAGDSRLSVWRNQTNVGLFENYNECLKRAKGDFIKPFAQDDILAPTQIEKQLGVLIENSDVALVSAGKRWIGPDGEELKRFDRFPESFKMAGDEAIIFNMITLDNWIGEPSTVMFRADRKGDGFDADFFHYGDMEYWFRIIQGSGYYYLSDVLCSFRRHGGSGTTRNLRGTLFALDLILLGKKYRSQLEDLGESYEHYVQRVIELSALYVDHLVKEDGLTVEDAVAIGTGKCRLPLAEDLEPSMFREKDLARVLAGFKELSFHSLRYVTSSISDIDHLRRTREDELALWQKEIHKLLESPSWKVTAPLRAIKDIVYQRKESN